MKDLSLHILDITENSSRAMASVIDITYLESINSNVISIEIFDNGNGMDRELLEKVTDPFTSTRTTRKIGLGIPLLKQNCEMTGGRFTIESEPGNGCTVHAEFALNHIDCPPTGDIPATIKLLVAGNPGIRWKYSHRNDYGEYVFDTDEVHKSLDGIPINEPQVLQFLKEMISENIIQLNNLVNYT